jgi:RNA polymerase sigma factor (sigma-70 family)
MNELTGAAIERALAGDRGAAEEVVRRAGRIALPIAMAVVGDRDDAADVAQDVVVDVLHDLGKLRDLRRFDAWVRRIAVRRALREAKARRRRLHAECPLDDDLAAGFEADDGVAAQAALRSALAGLPPKQRIALVLRYVHGLSDAQIAAALGCRPGTAGSLLSRGRALLRRNDSLAELATDSIAGGV